VTAATSSRSGATRCALPSCWDEFGVYLPVTTLLATDTVTSLAAAVRDHDGGGHRHLVPVTTAGSSLPLFAIHGGGGGGFFAGGLARHLGDDQPVYVLQGSPADYTDAGSKELTDVAARYVAEIRRVQSHGPYLLYGTSLGGAIAFEMAQQLRASGEQIGLLAMGDTRAPSLYRTHLTARLVAEWLSWLRRQPLRLAAKIVLTMPQRRINWYRHRHARPSVPASGEMPSATRRNELARQFFGRMLLRYRPRPCDDDVLLLRSVSEAPPYLLPWPRDLGWGALARVRIVDLPGEHLDLDREPLLSTIADILAAEINHVRASVPA
jgi:thioesterase domain-containing protein